MAGSNEEAGDSSVIIKLIADDTVKEFRTRTITLTEFNNTLRIGRASKVSTKGFVPAPDSAWFDSPVMSRNHAEIVANFQDKTVSIRDIGSLHGTFINGDTTKVKKFDPVEIRDGDQVTFGAPILRNLVSFTPATIKVGITHKPGRVRGTAPGSTFALPEYVDDESSDSSDEESSEPDEELVVSHIQGRSEPSSVELAAGGRQVDMVDLTDRDVSSNMDRTAGDLIDLTSPPRALSPDMEDDQENEEDLQVLHATAVILDKIVDNRSDRDGSDVGSPLSQDPDGEAESLGLSESMSDSAESEIGMDDDRSDDDEGSSSDEQKADWDAEYSSDDDVLDEDDPDTAVWASVEERPSVSVFARHGPSGVSFDAMEDDDMPPDAPASHTPVVDHPFSFAGPHPAPYYPLSESAPVFDSRMTLPSFFEPAARQASPSDAALPKRSVRLPKLVSLTGCGIPTAEALGEKTGKHEFFAARAENRRRVFAPSQQLVSTQMNEPRAACVPSSRPAMPEANQTVLAEPNVAEKSVASEKPMDDANPTVVDKPVIVEKQAALDKRLPEFLQPVNERESPEVLKPAEEPIKKPMDEPYVAEQTAAEEVQSPTEHGSAGSPKSSADRQTVAITPLLRTGDNFLNRAQLSVDFQLPSLPDDDTDEPISAYELQKRKLAAALGAQKKALAAQKKQVDMLAAAMEPEQSQSSRRTHVGISDIVDRSPVPAAQPEGEASVTAKGKRKADDMVELTQPEIQWAESTLMSHLRTANDSIMRHYTRFPHPPEPQARTANISKHTEPTNDTRAPKRLRLRKIAERLGYAALGGATVGAALVSTLICTAPTFT